MKKKALSLALALALCLVLPIPAMATIVVVSPNAYSNVGNFSEGLAAVRGVAYWGFVDKTGKEVVPCKYLEVRPFCEGLAAVCVDGAWGFVDKAGKEIVPLQYAEVGDFSDGLAKVQSAETYTWGFINKAGQEVIPCQYNKVESFSNELALVYSSAEKYYVYIDKTGKNVIPKYGTQYSDAESFVDGFARVKIGTRWTIIDKTGTDCIPQQYTHIVHRDESGWSNNSFPNEAVWVKNIKENKICLVDKTGQELVPMGRYYEVRDFSEGAAAVMKTMGTGWGFVDATGKEIIPCQYADVTDFSRGYSRVTISDGGSTYGIIDRTGKLVASFDRNIYDSFGTPSEGFLAVKSGTSGLYGFVDMTGHEVVPCQYTAVKNFSDGVAAVKNSTGWGLVDTTGTEIVPCRYEEIGNTDDVYTNVSESFVRVKNGAYWGLIAISDVPIPAPEPTTPVTPPADTIPASGTALASTQTVTVDGKAVEFQMYALADANGNLTNYIKLRDMAYILNGTKAQFSVGYDGTISLTTGQPYEVGGTEMTTPYSGDRAYKGGAQTLKVDGKDVAMTAITLTDDNGGGYNYFKLRDLGKALGFNVSWNNGVIVESDKPYAG